MYYLCVSFQIVCGRKNDDFVLIHDEGQVWRMAACWEAPRLFRCLKIGGEGRMAGGGMVSNVVKCNSTNVNDRAESSVL